MHINMYRAQAARDAGERRAQAARDAGFHSGFQQLPRLLVLLPRLVLLPLLLLFLLIPNDS